MKKRMLAMLMCVAMALSLLPMTVLAAEDDVLYVGGTNVISGGYWKGDGAGGLTKGSEDNYTVRYEPSTNTLTLKNASITKAFTKHTVEETTQYVYDENWEEYEATGYAETIAAYGIYSTSDLNLYLEGKTSITLSSMDASLSEAPNDLAFIDLCLISTGISSSTLTISGTGACTITAGSIVCDDTTYASSDGIRADNFIMESGRVESTGSALTGTGLELIKGGGKGYTYGIATDSFLMRGGTLTGRGGNVAEETWGDSYGLFTGNVKVSDGNLAGYGGNGGNSYGLYTNNTLTISGGDVTGYGGNGKYESHGIYNALGDITMTSGTLKGVSAVGQDSANFCGICFGSNFCNASLPETYWWRDSEDGTYTSSTEKSCLFEYPNFPGCYHFNRVPYMEVTSVDPTPVPEPAPKYTISVINGSADSSLAEAGTTVTITAAEKDGYTFRNWEVVSGAITLADANKKVTTFTMPEENVTVKAIFEKDAPIDSGDGDADATPAWDINVASTDYGSVSVSPTSAKQGETVKITVYPDKNCELVSLTAVDQKGNEMVLTNEGNGVYYFKMPDSKVSIYARFAKVELPVVELPFADVEQDDWFYDGVAYVVSKGMMKGVSDTAFSPNATTTRGMIVTILHRLEGTPTADASGFTDVEKGAWYQDAVDWAAANGIVNGTSQTTFAPNAPITREQMAAILYRYAAYKGYDVSQKADLSKYQDQGTIGAYAKDSMAWANAAGLITGVTDTTLSPRNSAIRAQVAAILMRFCENVAK